MKQEETYVGIDVAKDRLDVAIRVNGGAIMSHEGGSTA